MQKTIRMVVGMVAMSVTLLMAAKVQAAEITGQTMLAGKGAMREAVIYLEGGAKATAQPKSIIDQRDKTFIPHVTVIPRGTTVQFPNHDTVFHNVYAYFNAKKFDLGMYPRGATKTVTFDKTGVVALLCNVHSDMSAYIVVVDTPYYAISDSKGQFKIHGVPPGAYTLHAWHESGAVTTQPITVTGTDSTLTVTLARK